MKTFDLDSIEERIKRPAGARRVSKQEIGAMATALRYQESRLAAQDREIAELIERAKELKNRAEEERIRLEAEVKRLREESARARARLHDPQPWKGSAVGFRGGSAARK